MLIQFVGEFMTEKDRERLIKRQSALPEPLAKVLEVAIPIVEAFLAEHLRGAMPPPIAPDGPSPVPREGCARDLRFDGPADVDTRERMIADLVGAGYVPLVVDLEGQPVRWSPPGSPDGFGLTLRDAWKGWRDEPVSPRASRRRPRFIGPIRVDGRRTEPEAVSETVSSLIDAVIDLTLAGWVRDDDGVWRSPEGSILPDTASAIGVLRAATSASPGLHGLPEEHR